MIHDLIMAAAGGQNTTDDAMDALSGISLPIMTSKPNDYFGSSVSISQDGSTLAVGSLMDNTPASTATSGVYLFDKVNSDWRFNSKVTPFATGATIEDEVGYDVKAYAIKLTPDGTTLVVGTMFDNTSNGSKTGAAHVYTKTNNIWTKKTTLQASDGATGDQFGYAIDISDDGSTIAVGSRLDDNAAGVDGGSVYVYTLVSNVWTQQARVFATNSASTLDQLGSTVALSSDGNILACGAQSDDTSGSNNAGSVYIFTRSGSTWSEGSRLLAQGGPNGNNNFFGSALAMTPDGTTLAVGAWGYANNAGTVYIFTRTGSVWSQQARVQAVSPYTNDSFGRAVCISSDGNTLYAGTPLDDSPSLNTGSVTIFKRTGSTWSWFMRITSTNPNGSPQFGSSVSTIADGSIFVTGAPFASTTGGANSGEVYTILENGTVASTIQSQTNTPYSSDIHSGYSTTMSADGNFIAVGAPSDNGFTPGTANGSVMIYRRNGTTWIATHRLRASDGANGDEFGNCVKLSNDGTTLVVGAWSDVNSGGSLAGSCYVFVRSGTGWSQQARLQASDAAAVNRFGSSVDITADGNTLVVGASNAKVSTYAGAGAAYVFTRTGTAWSQQAKLVASNGRAGDAFGLSVCISRTGDMIVVGAPYCNVVLSDIGTMYVFTKPGATWTQVQLEYWAEPAHSPDAYFGNHITMSGNGQTLAVGVPNNTDGEGHRGAVIVYRRNGSTWDLDFDTPDFRSYIGPPLEPSERLTVPGFGTSVALSYDGSVLAVGSTAFGLNGGYVTMLTRSAGLWAYSNSLSKLSQTSEDGFGTSVALSDDGKQLVVGAEISSEAFVYKSF